jgi:uncharacterized iron-regulated membrane protein
MTGHRRSAASRARILVRRVHLWLGLSLGLLFAVLGVTGSISWFVPKVSPVSQTGPARLATIVTPEG